MEDQFIDAESEPWAHKEIDYEKIILKQIDLCTSNLSKERLGGFTNEKGRYVPNVNLEIINSVSVLENLMSVFLKEKDAINKLKKEMKEEIKKLGETQIVVGSYRGKLKNAKIPIPPSHPLMRWRIDYESDKAQEIFALLLDAFYKNKMKIRAMGRE